MMNGERAAHMSLHVNAAIPGGSTIRMGLTASGHAPLASGSGSSSGGGLEAGEADEADGGW